MCKKTLLSRLKAGFLRFLQYKLSKSLRINIYNLYKSMVGMCEIRVKED